MAQSLAHKFGQLIGDFIEIAIEPYLREFADKYSLFFDIKGERKTRTGVKLTWIDVKENKHDLDFVLERGGTDTQLGTPVAFIETAWRRYTKHSRNKAQEIQGAILPLIEKYNHSSPFIGVLLAGMFTKGALDQLKSQGFAVLYFEYKSVLAAFNRYGIDVSSNEQTEEQEFQLKIEAMKASPHKKEIAQELLRLNKSELDAFLRHLEVAVGRKITSVIIWPLHGIESILESADKAIDFLTGYSEISSELPFRKYEITVRYNTGTVISAMCFSKAEAIEFLNNYKTII